MELEQNAEVTFLTCLLNSNAKDVCIWTSKKAIQMHCRENKNAFRVQNAVLCTVD